MVEATHQRIEFPQESVIEIGDMCYIVTAHFDESKEPANEKLARLLKKTVCTLDNP